MKRTLLSGMCVMAMLFAATGCNNSNGIALSSDAALRLSTLSGEWTLACVDDYDCVEVTLAKLTFDVNALTATLVISDEDCEHVITIPFEDDVCTDPEECEIDVEHLHIEMDEDFGPIPSCEGFICGFLELDIELAFDSGKITGEYALGAVDCDENGDGIKGDSSIEQGTVLGAKEELPASTPLPPQNLVNGIFNAHIEEGHVDYDCGYDNVEGEIEFDFDEFGKVVIHTAGAEPIELNYTFEVEEGEGVYGHGNFIGVVDADTVLGDAVGVVCGSFEWNECGEFNGNLDAVVEIEGPHGEETDVVYGAYFYGSRIRPWTADAFSLIDSWYLTICATEVSQESSEVQPIVSGICKDIFVRFTSQTEVTIFDIPDNCDPVIGTYVWDGDDKYTITASWNQLDCNGFTNIGTFSATLEYSPFKDNVGGTFSINQTRIPDDSDPVLEVSVEGFAHGNRACSNS